MSFSNLAQQLLERGTTASVNVTKAHAAARALLAARLRAAGRSVTLVAKNSEDLAQLRALLQLFSPGAEEKLEDWVVMPPFPAGSHSRGAWGARLAALNDLRQRAGMSTGVIACLDSFLPKYPPARMLAELQLRLDCGADYAPELIIDQAVDWGFLRTPLVTQPGEITRRGDILDILRKDAPCALWTLTCL